MKNYVSDGKIVQLNQKKIGGSPMTKWWKIEEQTVSNGLI